MPYNIYFVAYLIIYRLFRQTCIARRATNNIVRQLLVQIQIWRVIIDAVREFGFRLS